MSFIKPGEIRPITKILAGIAVASIWAETVWFFIKGSKVSNLNQDLPSRAGSYVRYFSQEQISFHTFWGLTAWVCFVLAFVLAFYDKFGKK